MKTLQSYDWTIRGFSASHMTLLSFCIWCEALNQTSLVEIDGCCCSVLSLVNSIAFLWGMLIYDNAVLKQGKSKISSKEKIQPQQILFFNN